MTCCKKAPYRDIMEKQKIKGGIDMEFDLKSKVQPQLIGFFDVAKPWSVDSVDEIPETCERIMIGRVRPELTGDLAGVHIEERNIPSFFEDGLEAKVRIYTPAKTDENTSLLVFYRGSGFISGKLWQWDLFCGELCERTNCVVVASDYRLAPMNKYPAAIEDGYSALVWAYENRAELGAENDKLILVGASAGGGMALSAALMARDMGGPKIDLLCPLYPMVDHKNDKGSNCRIINDYVWDGKKNGKGWQAYLGDRLTDTDLSYKADAACAKTYRGLPPVYMYLGQCDALLDEGLELVSRLCADDVPTEFHLYPQVFHAFEVSYPVAQISHEAKAALHAVINRTIKEGFVK